MSNFTYKSINRDMGRAIHHYDMISDGDRILVGVSGGKDSLSLMWLLKERLARIPITYQLTAVFVDPGFEGGFSDPLAAWCRKMGIDLFVSKTDYGLVAHSDENRENPCFLCARLRRRRIFEIASTTGCNKVAFGHHRDDIIETFFLNICYTGVMSTMCPAQPIFNNRMTIIRPLAFIDEDRLERFAQAQGFPIFENPCPSAAVSKRREVKTILKQLYESNTAIKENIFRSLSHVNMEYMLK